MVLRIINCLKIVVTVSNTKNAGVILGGGVGIKKFLSSIVASFQALEIQV